MGLYETIHRSFVPFQTRVIMRSVPQIQRVISDLASNPHHSSALATSQIIYIYIYVYTKSEKDTFKERRRKSGYPLSDRQKKAAHLCLTGDPSSQTTQRSISNHCLKKGGATSKKSSLPQTHTPRSPPLP